MSKAQLLFDKFAERPIAYYPIYSRICGTITAGLLLSQLVYWGKISKWKKFFKTEKELREEIYMSRHEFLAAKKRLQSIGFVLTEIRKYPPVTFYEINSKKIIDAISNCPEIKQSTVRKLDDQCPEPGQMMSENRTNIYKTTTENTTYRIFEVWNSLKIVCHREFEKFESFIRAKLKNYSEEEIIQAMKNYKEILESLEHYYTHKWTLDKFLTRKGILDQFLDLEGAMRSFAKNSKGNGHRSQAEINSASSGQVVL